MLAHEDVQLPERLLLTAEREVAVDPIHQHGQPQLVELRNLVSPARLERRPASVGPRQNDKRLLEQLGGALGLAVGQFACRATRSCMRLASSFSRLDTSR